MTSALAEESTLSFDTFVSALSIDGVGNFFYSDSYTLYELPAGCSSSSCAVTVRAGYEGLTGPR
jgi:hypothetical protein